jgi:hypothetical protein
MLSAGQWQELSATVKGMVALVYFADPCSRRKTGDSSTKRVDRANSPFVVLSNTTNEGLSQQTFITEESIPLW